MRSAWRSRLISASSKLEEGQISHWKGCALANASRNAVFCAMLAAKGMTGPEEAFEGKAGFLNSTGIRFEITPIRGLRRCLPHHESTVESISFRIFFTKRDRGDS